MAASVLALAQAGVSQVRPDDWVCTVSGRNPSDEEISTSVSKAS